MKNNKINKSTTKWIKKQTCYYDDRFYIAEGYCNRWAETIYEKKYMCWKCVILKRRHKFSLWLEFAAFALFVGCYSTAVIWHKSLLLLFLAPILTGWLFYLMMNKTDFKHKGIIDYNGFTCQHCPKNFFNRDKKLFIKHLKKEHSEKWKEITKQLQEIPSDKRVVKIELVYILNEHKKEFKC